MQISKIDQIQPLQLNWAICNHSYQFTYELKYRNSTVFSVNKLTFRNCVNQSWKTAILWTSYGVLFTNPVQHFCLSWTARIRIRGLLRKAKVKLSLRFLTEHHAIKTYYSGGTEPRILDLGTRWRWVVSFTHWPLYPTERAAGTHWIGGWVGPRAVLDKTRWWREI
jgi:hypothetical protein